MKNILIILSILALSISACDKKSKRQYSEWTINGESFSTNDVEVAVGKARCGLAARDAKNRFSLGFNFGYELPKNGTYTITTTGGDPFQHVGLTFYYHDRFYIKSAHVVGLVTASSNNGKAQYELGPTWYSSYETPESDSVLIKGIFREP